MMPHIYLGTFRKVAFERQDAIARYARAAMVLLFFVIALASCAAAEKLAAMRTAQIEDARI